jgi:hypothetical protein
MNACRVDHHPDVAAAAHLAVILLADFRRTGFTGIVVEVRTQQRARLLSLSITT